MAKGKYEARRETAEVEKAFQQMTNPSADPKTTGNNADQKAAARPASKNVAAQQAAAKKRMIIMISASAAALVLIIGLIIGLVSCSGEPEDDGLILENVYAGNVYLGGKTVDEAKAALHVETDNTFSKKDMVIRVGNDIITLSPADTGAALDVDAVVEAAFKYGRTGSAKELRQAQKDAEDNNYVIALLPYLSLDLDYIEDTIEKFCTTHSSSLYEPVVTLDGVRPISDTGAPLSDMPHQTMTITMGTPEYVLDADDLCNQTLDAYSMHAFEITYEIPEAVEPKHPDAQEIFDEFCIAAADATIDSNTFEVTPEVVGYGFDVKELQKQIDQAGYGEKISITLDFIDPAITAEDLTEDMFKDTLAECVLTGADSKDEERNTNLKFACEAINDLVLKAGDEFSFNDILGRPSTRNGYSEALISEHNGSALGGGITQVTSALYYCALQANLDVIERHSHEYAVDFAELGLDAFVEWDSKDLRFRNNTTSPVRILASAEGSAVTIQFLGINDLNYSVKISSKIAKELKPKTTYQVMDKNNVLGYKQGTVLQEGITGYEVEVYMEKYDIETKELLSSLQVSSSKYSKRDEIVVRIGSTPDPTEPTESTEPTEATDPTEATEPTEETEPIEAGNE